MMLTLTTLALGASARLNSDPGSGQMKCTITKAVGPKAGEGVYKITMTSVTDTIPYKESWCGFSDGTARLAQWSGISVPAGCDKCTRSSLYSIKCGCTCPGGGGSNCSWSSGGLGEWTGTAHFNPVAFNPTCYCNGGRPQPPKPPAPPTRYSCDLHSQTCSASANGTFPSLGKCSSACVPCKAKLDVAVVLDGSASIVPSDWQKALSFTNKLVSSFNISTNQVELGVVQFSEVANVVIGLSPDATAIHTAVTNLIQISDNTNTFLGLKVAKTMIDGSTRSPKGKIVILLTDGEQNQGPPAKQIADALKAEGVIVFGIGVGNYAFQTLQSWVSLPLSQHFFLVNHFANLDTILQGLIQSACPPP